MKAFSWHLHVVSPLLSLNTLSFIPILLFLEISGEHLDCAREKDGIIGIEIMIELLGYNGCLYKYLKEEKVDWYTVDALTMRHLAFHETYR